MGARSEERSDKRLEEQVIMNIKALVVVVCFPVIVGLWFLGWTLYYYGRK